MKISKINGEETKQFKPDGGNGVRQFKLDDALIHIDVIVPSQCSYPHMVTGLQMGLASLDAYQSRY